MGGSGKFSKEGIAEGMLKRIPKEDIQASKERGRARMMAEPSDKPAEPQDTMGDATIEKPKKKQNQNDDSLARRLLGGGKSTNMLGG